jgi:hypothetical protein
MYQLNYYNIPNKWYDGLFYQLFVPLDITRDNNA